MGMYDESWCASCGASLPYSEEDVECGKCAQDAPDKLIELIEYIQIHLISLNQDMEDAQYLFRTNRDDHNSSKIDYLNGQISATTHLLSVALDIMLSTREKDE